MDIDIAILGMNIFWLIAAAAGGFVGAAIGANFSFAFTGFTALFSLAILAATGETYALDYIAFGPFFGPHVAFGGGAAAAAYAYWKGYLPDGKDINTPLASLGKPDVLLIGSAFGMGGYIVKSLVAVVPWFGSHTDAVAFTVCISGIVARLLFGDRHIFGAKPLNDTRSVLGKIAPREGAAWLRYQEKPFTFITYGVFFGIFAAGAAVILLDHFPSLTGNVQGFGFAISALTVLILTLGKEMPVQHHITISAGLAAALFYPAFDSGIPLLFIGAIAGVFASALSELAARVSYNRGDTHVDPPAMSIWITNTAIWLAAIAFAGA